MYVKLQFYGCKDNRFNTYNFEFQNCDVVISTLNLWEKTYIKFVNLNSYTDGIGWSWLMSGFGDKKISFEKLLPINLDNQQVKVSEGYNKPNEETLEVLARILELNRVPNKVRVALVATGVLENI